MKKKPTIACIIPARLKSTRFPEKILKNLAGKPILQWIYEKAVSYEIFQEVCFAVDSLETVKLIESFGGKWVMTSESCVSGTMRLVEYRNTTKKKYDFWLNWQADEPLIPKETVFDLISSINDLADVFTLKIKINESEADKPSFVKVVTDCKGQALYFSRAKIPFQRDQNGMQAVYYKHLGIYLYADKALDKIEKLTSSDLEEIEKLEQLTFLFNGLNVQVKETQQEGIGIDFLEDLQLAEKSLKKSDSLLLT